MDNSLFLQSDISDPYAVYAHLRAQQPVRHDDANGIWAVYSHADCMRVLETSSAHIPAQNPVGLSLLSDVSTALVTRLARLANPPHHAASRQVVMRLFACMQPVDTAHLLDRLLGTAQEIDWVDAVCKKLPALAVMKAFGFSERDIDAMLPMVESLTKIMLPNKSAQQADDINTVTASIWPLVERHVAQSMSTLADSDESRTLLVANLIGLLIQSYDAGRGMLSNALLQSLRHATRPSADHEACRRVVIETLRFDPPIQNTRRVLTDDLRLNKTFVPKGAAVLVVLASANRDEQVFERADCFDPMRSNAGAHLTFGAGAHGCAAHHFSVQLATDALSALFARYQNITLLQDDIRYEPMVNARLPKELLIRAS